MTEQEQQELEMLRKEKRQRTQQARAQAALAEDIRGQLPQQPPVVTPPAAPRPRRGIQRIR